MVRGRLEEERDASAAQATRARLAAEAAYGDDDNWDASGVSGDEGARETHPVASKWAAFLVSAV